MPGREIEVGAEYERSLPRAVRRAAGVFYTPAELIERVVDEALAEPLARARWRADGTPALRVLDPAAGTGRFLLACVERLTAAAVARRAGEGRRPDPAALRRAIVRRCIVGVERDPSAAALARAALGPGADVRVGEALLGELAEDGAWDVVVGNPPYVRSVALKRADPALWARLRGAFRATSYREWDLYAAFLERAWRWAAPGGQVGLVVPSRWLTAAFAAPLRAWLAERRAARKIVDFGHRQLFEGSTTYIALVFLAADGSDVVQVEREGRTGAVPARALGSGPWTLEVGALARRLARLRAAGPALGAVARIAKGAGTNADSIFLLDDAAAAAHGIEDEALVPCLRGRDVAAWGAQAVRRALLPYDAAGRLLAPEELRRRWPNAAAYLGRHRAALEAREAGRYRGPTFYRWGRPQNLAWLRAPEPKVVVPDAAARGRAALDSSGRLVIDTAYAVRPTDPAAVSIGLLLAVLNSPVVAEWLRATGISLRGGYFRMKTAYLASLPLPDPASRAARAVARAALALDPSDAGAQREIETRVLALYRLA